MIITRLSGGLGNQMFQYAFGLAQAARHGVELKLDASIYGTAREPRPYSLDAFEISGKKASALEILWNKLFKKTVEPRPAFSTEVLSKTSGYFKGNWQTEKYFTDIADKVRAEFTLKSWSDKASSFREMIVGDPASISVHVRRGDYATNPHLSKKHGLLSAEYYKSAIDKIVGKTPNAHIYIFSDDIAWVRANLSFNIPVTFVSGNGLTIPEEMMLMSLCRYHIIANSSYSWWGAWLDPRPDKTVIAPAVWYAVGIDAGDLVPDGWTRL